jgi:hypothetical protein
VESATLKTLKSSPPQQNNSLGESLAKGEVKKLPSTLVDEVTFSYSQWAIFGCRPPQKRGGDYPGKPSVFSRKGLFLGGYAFDRSGKICEAGKHGRPDGAEEWQVVGVSHRYCAAAVRRQRAVAALRGSHDFHRAARLTLPATGTTPPTKKAAPSWPDPRPGVEPYMRHPALSCPIVVSSELLEFWKRNRPPVKKTAWPGIIAQMESTPNLHFQKKASQGEPPKGPCDE